VIRSRIAAAIGGVAGLLAILIMRAPVWQEALPDAAEYSSGRLIDWAIAAIPRGLFNAFGFAAYAVPLVVGLVALYIHMNPVRKQITGRRMVRATLTKLLGQANRARFSWTLRTVDGFVLLVFALALVDRGGVLGRWFMEAPRDWVGTFLAPLFQAVFVFCLVAVLIFDAPGESVRALAQVLTRRLDRLWDVLKALAVGAGQLFGRAVSRPLEEAAEALEDGGGSPDEKPLASPKPKPPPKPRVGRKPQDSAAGPDDERAPPFRFKAPLDALDRVLEAAGEQADVDMTASEPEAQPGVEQPDEPEPADEPYPIDRLDPSNEYEAAMEATRADLEQLAEPLIDICLRKGCKVRFDGERSACGPSVLRLAFSVEGRGDAINRLKNLDVAFQNAVGADHPVRAVLGNGLIADVPRPLNERLAVPLSYVLARRDGRLDGKAAFPLGVTPTGEAVWTAFDETSHALVAGQAGSGKTIWLHAMILSLMTQHPPSRLRLALVDFNGVSLHHYEGMPHLWGGEVITERKAFQRLCDELADELERRKPLLKRGESLPYLITVIDEFADVVGGAGGLSEDLFELVRLGRKFRMYFVISTQHPRADVIDTTVKANLGTRVALRVPHHAQSQLVISESGAEKLLGRGDLLVRTMDRPTTRLQGAYVSDQELKTVSEWRP